MLGRLRGARPDPGPRRQLEAALHAALALGPDDIVRLTEIGCGVSGCSDLVIAVMIMRPGCKTQIHRVERDLASVTLGDLLDAMRPPAADPRTTTLADALAGLATAGPWR